MPKRDLDRGSFRFELRSTEQLAALASAPLPLGMSASAARRSAHRDLYLDSADESLRRRGILLRLRIGAEDRHQLSLRIDGSGSDSPIRVDARVHAVDLRAALAEDNSASRRLRAFVDPDLLAVQLDLEVERLTRTAHPDFFRRPRLELHFDRLTVRQSGIERTFHHLCGHLRRGDVGDLNRLARALEAEHDLRRAAGDPREHAELLVRWKRSDSRREQLDGSDQTLQVLAAPATSPPELLNPELSLVAFQRRVLAIAADPATPLRERLRFLGIVSSNLDELHMVRMSGLRRAAGESQRARTAR